MRFFASVIDTKTKSYDYTDGIALVDVCSSLCLVKPYILSILLSKQSLKLLLQKRPQNIFFACARLRGQSTVTRSLSASMSNTFIYNLHIKDWRIR